jgi:hypothetical protein
MRRAPSEQYSNDSIIDRLWMMGVEVLRRRMEEEQEC